MASETVMTFASLLVALLAAVALLYGSFVFAYLIDLLGGNGVPPMRFLGSVIVTGASVGALAALARVRNAF